MRWKSKARSTISVYRTQFVWGFWFTDDVRLDGFDKCYQSSIGVGSRHGGSVLEIGVEYHSWPGFSSHLSIRDFSHCFMYCLLLADIHLSALRFWIWPCNYKVHHKWNVSTHHKLFLGKISSQFQIHIDFIIGTLLNYESLLLSDHILYNIRLLFTVQAKSCWDIEELQTTKLPFQLANFTRQYHQPLSQLQAISISLGLLSGSEQIYHRNVLVVPLLPFLSRHLPRN